MPIEGSSTTPEVAPPLPAVTHDEGLNDSSHHPHTQNLPLSSPPPTHSSYLTPKSEVHHTTAHDDSVPEHGLTNETHTEIGLNDEDAVGGMGFSDPATTRPTRRPLTPTQTVPASPDFTDFFGGVQGHEVAPSTQSAGAAAVPVPVGIAGLASQTVVTTAIATAGLQRITEADGDVVTITQNAVVPLAIPTIAGASVTMLTVDADGVLEAIIYTVEGGTSLIPAQTLRNGKVVTADPLSFPSSSLTSSLFSSFSSTSTAPTAAETSKRPDPDHRPNIIGFSVVGAFFAISACAWFFSMLWRRYRARKEHMEALGLEQGQQSTWNDDVFDPKAEWFGARKPELEDDSSLAAGAPSEATIPGFGDRREPTGAAPNNSTLVTSPLHSTPLVFNHQERNQRWQPQSDYDLHAVPCTSPTQHATNSEDFFVPYDMQYTSQTPPVQYDEYGTPNIGPSTIVNPFASETSLPNSWPSSEVASTTSRSTYEGSVPSRSLTQRLGPTRPLTITRRNGPVAETVPPVRQGSSSLAYCQSSAVSVSTPSMAETTNTSAFHTAPEDNLETSASEDSSESWWPVPVRDEPIGYMGALTNMIGGAEASDMGSTESRLSGASNLDGSSESGNVTESELEHGDAHQANGGREFLTVQERLKRLRQIRAAL